MDGNFPSQTQNSQEIAPQQETVLYNTAPVGQVDQNSYNDESGGIFNKDKIIKIVIGLIAVIVVLFLAFVVIIPRLQPKAPEKVVLTYWGLWEDASVFAPIISDFKREHPNVEVKYEKQDIKTLGKYVDRLNTRIGSGTGPDIFRFHNSWLTQTKNLLLPLPSDVVSESNIDTEYYSVVKKDTNINGAYYGIPLGIDTLALFINTDIFKAGGVSNYPGTWDDVVKTSRQLTVKDETGKIKTAGIALGTFDNIAHSSDIISMLFIQNGADMRDLVGERKQNALDAVNFYVSFAKDDSRVWDDTLANSKLAFAKGELAMYLGYSWDIPEIKSVNPNLQFAVVKVPHVSGASPDGSKTIASYWTEGVSVKSKHPKEAFEFIKFLSKKETLEKLYTQESKLRGFGELYPRQDMQSLLKDNAIIFPFVDQADNSASTFFSSDTYDNGMNSVLNAYLGNAVRSVLGNTSTDTALETLQQGVAQVFSRYEQNPTQQ